MRVLQLIDRLLPSGGAERLVERFARNAPGRGGLEVIVGTLGPSEPALRASLEAEGMRVVHFRAPFAADPRRIVSLARFLARESVDLVHAHLVRSTVVGVAASRLAGRPCVVTLHNARRARTLPRWLRAAESWALRAPRTRVLACGWETAEAHRARVAPAAITVVPNSVAVAPRGDPRRAAALREELRVPEAAPMVIAVGRLHEQKGFFDLLAAHQRLLGMAPDAHLVIVGEGDLRAPLEEAIESLELGDRVRMTGLRADVPELLGASDLFVSSSLWEGLPVAMLEAMAAALPVVATSVGDVPRIVDERCGRLVEASRPDELAEAIGKVLADLGLARAMGEAGRRRVSWDFGIDAWIDRHLEIYEEVRLS